MAEKSTTIEGTENVVVGVGTETQEVNTKREGVSEERVAKLAKPYVFKGEEHEKVDLLELEKLTIRGAIDTQLELFGMKAVASMLCEITTAFARAMAAKAIGLSVEFFKLMPHGAPRRVAGMVRRHMNAGDETENHVMQLGKPHSYKGKGYREIDLNGVTDLGTLNESRAENRIAREGFTVTENGTNYLYACVIVLMAAGIPEDFFTLLPLYEPLKLKNVVNDADFLE